MSGEILKETIGCPSDNLILNWNNLTCSVKTSANETAKNILNNVTGSVRSKSFTAILGPSGAGKTTLLEGISCRSNNIRGTVSINGCLVNHAFMKEVSGFQPQHDIGYDCLTANEHLQFVCSMKMHRTLHSWDRSLRVSSIINKFGLQKCQNTQLSKLSGGERRRLFLGTELLSDPAIIFCDEPTTGLDSYNALQIVSILRNLSFNGKIIIISIHQPSSELIKYFDNLILLSRGNVIMEGCAENITSFLSTMNIICPAKCNLAEFFIQQIAVKPGDEENCKQRIDEIHNNFLKYQKSKNLDSNNSTALKKIRFKEKLRCSYYAQFFWLLWREVIILRRGISTEIAAFSVLIITAFIIALFYSSVEENFEKFQNLNGFLYLVVSELLFTATYSVLYTFPQEIPIFKNERELYSSVPYYLVKICSQVPHIIIYPYSFLLVLYLIVPLNLDIYLYFNMGFAMCVASFTAKAYGFMLSALSDSTDYVNLIIVPMDTLFLMTSGIFLKLDTFPFLLTWIKYISSFFYAFDAISILYWSKNNFTGANGTQLEYVNDHYYNYNYDLFNLIILAVVMYSIGCLVLIRKKKQYSKIR